MELSTTSITKGRRYVYDGSRVVAERMLEASDGGTTKLADGHSRLERVYVSWDDCKSHTGGKISSLKKPSKSWIRGGGDDEGEIRRYAHPGYCNAKCMRDLTGDVDTWKRIANDYDDGADDAAKKWGRRSVGLGKLGNVTCKRWDVDCLTQAGKDYADGVTLTYGIAVAAAMGSAICVACFKYRGVKGKGTTVMLACTACAAEIAAAAYGIGAAALSDKDRALGKDCCLEWQGE